LEPTNPEREVFVMKADGSGLTNITNSPSDDHDPIWLDCTRPTAGCEARVTNIQPDTLNIRQDAAVDAQAVGTLSEGDTVCLTGASQTAGGYKWWPVSTADGTEGWAAAFDPKDPATPWLTPTGNPCGGEPEESAAPSSGGERPICKNPARLGESVSDPEGDVSLGFADIVSARVEVVGQEVVAEIELRDLPEELTFNSLDRNELEYAWEILFDVDGDPATGCSSFSGQTGFEFSLSVEYASDPEYRSQHRGALLDNVQADIWKPDEDCGGWGTDWGETLDASAATATVNGNRLTIRGVVPGIGPSTRWCAATYYQDPEETVTEDAAPD